MSYGKTGGDQALFCRFAVKGPYIAVADDADLLCFAQCSGLGAETRQQAAADFHTVLLRCVYFDDGHPSTASFRCLPSSRRVMRVSRSSAATASR